MAGWGEQMDASGEPRRYQPPHVRSGGAVGDYGAPPAMGGGAPYGAPAAGGYGQPGGYGAPRMGGGYGEGACWPHVQPLGATHAHFVEG